MRAEFWVIFRVILCYMLAISFVIALAMGVCEYAINSLKGSNKRRKIDVEG